MYNLKIQRNTYILHDVVVDDNILMNLFSRETLNDVEYTVITVRDNKIMIPTDKFCELTITVSKIERRNTITF